MTTAPRNETAIAPLIGKILAERAGVQPASRLYQSFIETAGRDAIAAFRANPIDGPTDEVEILAAEVLQAEAERREMISARLAAAQANLDARRAASAIDPAIRRLHVRDEVTGKVVVLDLPAEWCRIRQGNGGLVPMPAQ